MKIKELLIFRYYFMIQNELVGIFGRPAGRDLVRTTGE